MGNASELGAAEAQLEMFFQWRGHWNGARDTKQHSVPGLALTTRYVLAFCCKRFSGLQRFCRDQVNRDEALHVVRLTLLDPTQSFRYEGVGPGIRFFGLRAKQEIVRMMGIGEVESLDALQASGVEVGVPQDIPHENRSLLTFAGWCHSDVHRKKWAVLALLQCDSQLSWEDIREWLSREATADDEELWEYLRGHHALPAWSEIHGWFQTPPPALKGDSRALRQFYSRLSRVFRTEVLEDE